LVSFCNLGGSSVAGGKLKETGTAHWRSPNTGASNETGFTALPGSIRGYDAVFESIGFDGFWWTSTESSIDAALYRQMFSGSGDVHRSSYFKSFGFSVRCVQD